MEDTNLMAHSGVMEELLIKLLRFNKILIESFMILPAFM